MDGSTGVYGSLEDVVVPDGTPPGASFKVFVQGRRGNKSVPIAKQLWRASGQVPIIQQRVVTTVTGPRHAQRPSAQAQRSTADRSARAIDHVQSQPAAVDSWIGTAELPYELNPADVGWLPGPVGGSAGRALPAFTGAPSGPKNVRLTARSTARTILRDLHFTPNFLSLVLKQTRNHAAAWSRDHPAADGTERAFHRDRLVAEHVELWFAARVLIAQLNPSVPMEQLWNSNSYLFNPDLARALPFFIFKWLGRHLSFGKYGNVNESNSDDDGGGEDDAPAAPVQSTCGYDRFVKRRCGSDIVRKQCGTAFACGQHCGLDDFIRPTRKGVRTRHKAAVHTGKEIFGLNDARTNYFLWWEEDGWVDDSNTITPPTTTTTSGTSGTSGRPETNISTISHNTNINSIRLSSGCAGGRGGGRGSNGQGRGTVNFVNDASADGASSRQPGHGSHGNSAPDSSIDYDADGAPASRCVSKLRLQRATSVLRPGVGHCLWFDRGVTSLAALDWLHSAGFHGSGVVQKNRIGIPRRFLAWLAKEMTCPAGCTHDLTASRCKRWSWTVLHKGELELQVWCDVNAVVVLLTHCTSATRLVPLTRQVRETTYVALAPEGIGFYNFFGRNCTDGGDQQRRRLSLAARRQERQGPKGALFDFEIAMVNGMVIAEALRGAEVTVWDFGVEYARDVLRGVVMRERDAAAGESAASGECASTRAHILTHQPLWDADENRKRKREASCADTRVRRVRGGHCCMFPKCAKGEPVRAHLFCSGCKSERDKCNGWYHFACYWKRHKAVTK